MNYYHLTTHPLAKKISDILDKNAAAKKVCREFNEKIGATASCGWAFFFENDKKPNKHWIKVKKQRWDGTAYTPSKKTEEGIKLFEEIKELPIITGGGFDLMRELFGDDEKLNARDNKEDGSGSWPFYDAYHEHGSIGFKRVNGEIYMEGSEFWLLGETEGAKEISNIEYREAK